MTLVSTVTVGAGGAASIEFTGIPATGTDLVLMLSMRSTASTTNDTMRIRFNNDSGGNYTQKWLRGDGASVFSSGDAGFTSFRTPNAIVGNSATASTFSNVSIYVPNYAGSTAKSVSADVVTENNATTASEVLNASVWTGTAAISSIQISLDFATNLAQYSTASLYTITKGSGGATVS